MSAYTNDDVMAAKSALGEALWEQCGLATSSGALIARAILDAIAPAIAARALREAADEFYIQHLTGDSAPVKVTRAQDWLRTRADEIERT